MIGLRLLWMDLNRESDITSSAIGGHSAAGSGITVG